MFTSPEYHWHPSMHQRNISYRFVSLHLASFRFVSISHKLDPFMYVLVKHSHILYFHSHHHLYLLLVWPQRPASNRVVSRSAQPPTCTGPSTTALAVSSAHRGTLGLPHRSDQGDQTPDSRALSAASGPAVRVRSGFVLPG